MTAAWLQVLLPDQEIRLPVADAAADAQQGELCDKPQVICLKIKLLPFAHVRMIAIPALLPRGSVRASVACACSAQ